MAFKFSAEAKEFVPATTQQGTRQFQDGGEKGPNQDETWSQDTKSTSGLVRSLSVTAPEFIPNFGAPSYEKSQFGSDVVSDFADCNQRVLSWADESSKNVLQNVSGTQNKQSAVFPQTSNGQWGLNKDVAGSYQKRSDYGTRKDWKPKAREKTERQTSAMWIKDKVKVDEKVSKNMKFDGSDARSKRKAPRRQKAKEGDIKGDLNKQSKESSSVAKMKSDVDRNDNEIAENQKGKVNPPAKYSPTKTASGKAVAVTNRPFQERNLWVQNKSLVNERKPQNVVEDAFPALGKQNPQRMPANDYAPKQNSWSKIVQHQPTKKEVDVRLRRETEMTQKTGQQHQNKGSNEQFSRKAVGSQMRGVPRGGVQAGGRSRVLGKDAIRDPEQRPNRSSSFKDARKRDDTTSETRQKPKVFESYQGDLEWRRESAEAKKEHSFSHTRGRGRNSGYGSNSRKPFPRESSTSEKGLQQNGMVTERYRYDFVTKKFSDNVKRKLLGAYKDEKEARDAVKRGETARGWYGEREFGARKPELDHGIPNRREDLSDVSNFTWFKITEEAELQIRKNESADSRPENEDLNKPTSAWANRSGQIKTSHRICPDCRGVLDNSSYPEKPTGQSSQQINVCHCGTHYQRGTEGKELILNPNDVQGISIDRPSSFSSAVNEGVVRKRDQVPVASPVKESGNKLVDLNMKSFEEIVDLEVDEGIEINEADDDDGWITVEEKSKVKSRRQKQQSEAEKQEVKEPVVVKRKPNREDREQREEGFKNRSNDGRRGNGLMNGKDFSNEGKGRKPEGISQKDEERNKPKNPKAKAEKKVTAVRKKSKRKDIPMYENDQKKIKEFKMRQMIEEDLKLDLLQMTRTRHTNDGAIHGEEDSAKEAWPAIGQANIRTANIMSFSEVLKQRTAPKVQMRTVPRPAGVLKIDPWKLTEEERIELKRKKFKEKRKVKKKERKERKKAEKEENNPAVGGEENDILLSKTPINLDLAGMLDRLLTVKSSGEPNEPRPTKQSHSKSTKAPKRTIFSTGVISVASGLAKWNNKDGRKADTKVSANALDSTQPVRMRGKEREKPKRKRLTLLKKAILREREEKRKKREAEERIDNNDNTNLENESDEPNSKLSKETLKTQMNGDENSEATAIGGEEQTAVCEASKDTPKHSTQDISATCEPLNTLPREIIAKIHNRKFREYCDQFLTKEIDQLVCKILKDLQRFQTRVYLENPNKAKAKRRLVLGIREVSRHLKLSKLKCVIMAPNLEKVSAEGGIDHHLGRIIFDSKQFSIPIIYSMSRQALGMTLKRKVPVSVIGIFNYAGVEDDYKNLCTLVEEQREKYKLKIEQLMTTQGEEDAVKEASARNTQHKPKRDNRQKNGDSNDNRMTELKQR